jgi:hypothetical protein
VEFWGKVQTFYERKGFSARFYFWQKLFALQLADYRKHGGNAMEFYLDAFRAHVQQLRSSGPQSAMKLKHQHSLMVSTMASKTLLFQLPNPSARQPMTKSMWSN